jgi:hypothetical protein
MSHAQHHAGVLAHNDGSKTGLHVADADDRVRDADMALAAGEHDHAGQIELDDLSTEVITANVAQPDERIAPGWRPSSDARHQLDRDRQLLLESQGSMSPHRDA